MKKRHSSTPRRKRMNQPNRLRSAKTWMPTYKGKNIVNGYARWFGVDMMCAIRELRMIGVTIPEEYEEKVKRSIEERSRHKKLQKEKRKRQQNPQDYDSDGEWAYIAGYTTAGFPFGIRHEELEEMEKRPSFELFEDEELFELYMEK